MSGVIAVLRWNLEVRVIERERVKLLLREFFRQHKAESPFEVAA